jgi:hypothetical protein
MRLTWTLVPVPHGCAEPRIDWSPYQTQKPSENQIRSWIRKDNGLGVVCGRPSANLAALEFQFDEGYYEWSDAYPALAKKCPTMSGGGGITYVFFRTEEEIESTKFTFQEYEGQILAKNRVVPLPPTLDEFNDPYSWDKPIEGQPPLLTIEELGVEAAAHDESHAFENLFKPTPEYFGDAGPKLNWVVEGLLPETYLAVLAGASKSGKSCLVTALAMSVATGEAFLGFPTVLASVLWVAFEESREERLLAIEAFGKTPDNLFTSHEKLYIDTAEGIAALRWWIRKTSAKLLVIDPLYAACKAESLSDGRTARDTLSGLKELCRTEHIAAIVLHHITKDTSAGLTRERFADSNQIVAAASMDILMDVKDARKPGVREIWLQARGRGAFANQVWLLQSTGIANYTLVGNGRESDMLVSRKTESILDPLRQSQDPMSAEEIAEILGVNTNSLRNRLTAMAKDGLVSIVGKRSKTTLYTLNRQPLTANCQPTAVVSSSP